MRRLLVLMAVLGLLNSCAHTPEERRQPGPRAGLSAVGGDTADHLAMAGDPGTAGGGVMEAEFYEGSGTFIDEQAARERPAPVTADGEIVLNFEGESIQSVVHTILGEVLQETFVIGPGVSGQVTFATSKPVTREQLMPILELLLKWNGATLVWHEGRYHVLPVADAIKGHLVPRMGGVDQVRGYEVRAVPLQYISAVEMAKILEPYARPDAIVNIDLMRSMIFLAGTREELTNYLKTVEIFDVDWLAGMSVGIYPLNTVDVGAITTELTAVFGMEADSPLAGLFRFVPLERLASVMVITPREEYLETAREWIERLDRGAAGAGTQLFVYRVKNLEAQVLAGYLTQLFGGGSRGGDRGRRSNLAPGLEPVTMGRISEFNRNRQTANQRGVVGDEGGQGAAGGTGVIDTEQGEIRITSVVETNSLLIQATQAQYASIQAAIDRIDQQPLQVLVEAQVLDVVLNENLEYGVSWFLSNNPDRIPAGSGNPFGRVIDFAEFGTNLGADGSGFGVIGTLSDTISGGKTFVQATISALDSVSDLRSIAAPSLVVRNNSQASITVGQQIPVTSTAVNTQGNTVTSAQYVSTGVTLTVTPRINPGGMVYMDVTQEVTRPGPAAVQGGNPPIDNKSVGSQVAVQSGQTVFLGGLIQEQDTRGSSGVPFLNRVPVIGALFGRKTTDKLRIETIVMITPTVLESTADLQAITEDLRDEFIRIPPFRIHTIQD